MTAVRIAIRVRACVEWTKYHVTFSVQPFCQLSVRLHCIVLHFKTEKKKSCDEEEYKGGYVEN